MTGRLSWPFRRSRKSKSNATQESTRENELEFGSAHASNTLEDIGALMIQQGEFLDELTNRTNSLAAENVVLRERLSSGINSSSSKSRASLRNSLSTITHKNKMKGEETLQKLRNENEMLLEQADLLAKQCEDANNSIADRDSSITSLSQELSKFMEKARRLTIEERERKAEMLDRAAEIDSLKLCQRQSSSQRSELSAMVEQLQSEVEHYRAEADMLVSSFSRSAAEKEELHAALLLKQSEVEQLHEERREIERKLHLAQRDVKESNEASDQLRKLCSQHRLEYEELKQKLKDVGEELFKSDLQQQTLQSRADFLEEELDKVSKANQENVASISGTLSKIKQQHDGEIQSKDIVIDKLRRSLSQLEIENSSNQREKQSLEQRCLSLKRSLDTNAKDQHNNFQELLHRAVEGENQLERAQKVVKDMKMKVVQLEAKIQAAEAETVDKESILVKIQTNLEEKLKTKVEQCDALSKETTRLKEESKQTQQANTKAATELQQETESRVRTAEKEIERMKATCKAVQFDMTMKEDLHEKEMLNHHALLDEMTSEKKEQRYQMEAAIRRERDVNARLMTKTQELSNTIHKLSTDNFQLKETQYANVNKIQGLENVVVHGEARLKALGSSFCKLSEEQEHLISKESETKRRLHEAKIDLEKMKHNMLLQCAGCKHSSE